LRVHGGKVEEDVCELEAKVVLGVGMCGVVTKGRVPSEICANLLHTSLLVSVAVQTFRCKNGYTYINRKLPSHPD